MTITASVRQPVTPAAVVTGAFLDTGTVKKTVVNLGFKPRRVKLVNATDRISYEWFDGMAANSALKVIAAGTATLETSDGITVGAIVALASAPVTIYEPTTYNVGTPGVSPAEKSDCSRVNTKDETLYGFSIPAAVVITGKQFYFEAVA